MADTTTTALQALLAGVLKEYDANTCRHESTHRGGAIWTICDDCGQKWADDRGGFKPYKDSPAIAAARAALSAAQDAPAGLPIDQEPKYTVNGAHIINRASGEVIPWDEPVFIFRARDVHAVNILAAYAREVRDPEHALAVWSRVRDFKAFWDANPSRMKQPDTARASQPTPAQDAVERALQAFEDRERGKPQAVIAARLVAELRAALAADHVGDANKMVSAQGAVATVPDDWSRDKAAILEALRRADMHLLKGVRGYEVRRLGPAVASDASSTPPAPQAAPTAAQPAAGQGPAAELLPCPFCGADDISTSECDDDSFVKSLVATCNGCGCTKQSSLDWRPYSATRDYAGFKAASRAKIAQVWNARAVPTTPQAPALVPLTDAQIRQGWREWSVHPKVDERFTAGVKFAERAHSIGIFADTAKGQR